MGEQVIKITDTYPEPLPFYRSVRTFLPISHCSHRNWKKISII